MIPINLSANGIRFSADSAVATFSDGKKFQLDTVADAQEGDHEVIVLQSTEDESRSVRLGLSSHSDENSGMAWELNSADMSFNHSNDWLSWEVRDSVIMVPNEYYVFACDELELHFPQDKLETLLYPYIPTRAKLSLTNVQIGASVSNSTFSKDAPLFRPCSSDVKFCAVIDGLPQGRAAAFYFDLEWWQLGAALASLFVLILWLVCCCCCIDRSPKYFYQKIDASPSEDDFEIVMGDKELNPPSSNYGSILSHMQPSRDRWIISDSNGRPLRYN